MLKVLLHFHARILSLKHRKRFNKVFSSGRYSCLTSIFRRLQTNDSTLTDTEILSEYYKFSKAAQTNTFAAAELEFVAISLICYYRPHLTKQLIRSGLLCIVYSIGEEINSDTVVEFVSQRILSKNASPYAELPPKEGVLWLKEILPKTKETIQPVLESVIEENRREINEDY